MRNTVGTMTAMKRIMSQVNLWMPLSKLVWVRSTPKVLAKAPK